MKDLSYLALSDIYGEALTQKQRQMLADYYERDYSLSEIADNSGISRQAVHAAVRQAQDSLSDYESKFRVHAFVSELHRELAKWEGESSAAKEKAEVLEALIRRFYGSVWQP